MKESEFQEEWLSAYLDDELTDEQRQVVEQRLAIDPAAHMMLDDLRRVRAMVAQLPGWSGAEFKFAIPDVLPGATQFDSQETGDELSDDDVTDHNDFEEVPRAVAESDEAVIPKSTALESATSSDAVGGTGAAWGGESRGSPRSMLAWFATAASVLLMAGLGYFFWPSGSLVVSQLDRGVGTAAPSSGINEKAMQRDAESTQQDDSMDTLATNEDASPNKFMFGGPADANASATDLSATDSRSDFGAMRTRGLPEANGADAAVSDAKSVIGELNRGGIEKGLTAREQLRRDSGGGIAGATVPDSAVPGSAVPEILSMQSTEPAASSMSQSGAAGSPALALPSMQSAMPGAALLPPNRVTGEESKSVEVADAARKAADEVAGGFGKSNYDATLNPSLDPSGLSANASRASNADLPHPAAPKDKADQDFKHAERELLHEQAALDSIKREQVQIVDSLDGANSAPAVIVARSSKWNEDETLQYAATQATTFYGENALNFRQSGQDAQALPSAVKENPPSDFLAAAGSNADVLMATVKTDPAATEALFNSVVTSNQFLPVEPQQVTATNQLANPGSAILGDSPTDRSDLTIPTEPTNANASGSNSLGSNALGSNGSGSSVANYWYHPTQRGRAAQSGPQGNSLMLFVTREEANRILKELQEQGQVTSPVWRVVQRSEAGADDFSNSQTRGTSETRSRTAENPPSEALNSLDQQQTSNLSKQSASPATSPATSRFSGEPPEQSRNAPSQASEGTATWQSTAIPAPADSDKVILMLNGSPQ